MTALTDADREHARALARRHREECRAAGCLAEHERRVAAIVRAHHAEQKAS